MQKLPRQTFKGNRRFTFFLCFFLGFVVAFTTLLAIIHEYGHILGTGETIKAYIKDWKTVSFTGHPTLGFLLAGWAFQYFVFAVLWGFAMYFGNNYPNVLFDIGAGFSWGFVNGTLIQALRSQDFVDVERYLDMAVLDVQVAWLLSMGPPVIIGWLIVWNSLKKY